MNLKEKLNNIKKTSVLKALPRGTAKDFDELWKNLIEPELPEEHVVIEWHELLKQYVDKKDVNFFIRAFAGPSGDSTLLRRGFYNTTDYGYNVAFVDNGFTSYFYSMARDGFVPSLKEFEICIKDRSFPCAWIQTKEETHYAAYRRGKNPGICTKGYKIAHIYSAGKDFNRNSPFSTIADLCNKYFPRGINAEWDPMKTDAYGSFHYRYVSIPEKDADQVRRFLIAHFIRMVHPINYFLVPNKINRYDAATGIMKTNILWNDNGEERDEIGENQELINYVAAKLQAKYGTVYNEFLSYIYPIMTNEASFNKQIDARYGLNIWKECKASVSADKVIIEDEETIAKSIAPAKMEAKKGLSPFEIYAAQNGVSNAPYYSALIKSIMRELNISSLEELEECIDAIIDCCTKKIEAARKTGDKKEEKKYSNYRSALRKYGNYLEERSENQNSDDFLRSIETFMIDSNTLAAGSIRIYLRKIKMLLQQGISVDDLYGGIDKIIKDYSEGGELYDPKDHGNIKSALEQVAKMIKQPYIYYDTGWRSFVPVDESIRGYCIDGDVITIFKTVNFIHSGNVVKKIPNDCYKKLIEILDTARKYNLFGKSDSCIKTIHGTVCNYSYSYRGISGNAGLSLFIDDSLQAEYIKLIKKITE